MIGLNWNQTTVLFQDADQTDIMNTSLVQLATESINNIEYLANFENLFMDQVANNLGCPEVRVLDPNPGVNQGETTPTLPYVFGEKPQKHILPDGIS